MARTLRPLTRTPRLGTKFAVLVVALLTAVCSVWFAWATHSQEQQMVGELREKGEVLSQQMWAMWQFMADNQDKLLSAEAAYTNQGDYRGLHCAIVGRSIATLFTQESDYVTRFVNFDPRNPADSPDEFEAEALEAFLADPGLQEYYGISTYGDQEVFRYLRPMTVGYSCLTCHGEPAGETDQTGYAKEGLALGDNCGAISIVIPLDVYMASSNQQVKNSIALFAVLLGVLLLCVAFSVRKLVTAPLERVQQGVESMRAGKLDIRIPETESSRELDVLVGEFNAMSAELSAAYSGLEEQVESRTRELREANAALEAQHQALEGMNRQLVLDNEYKSEFLSMISHELRTPLASIISFSDILKQEMADKGLDEGETIRQIEASSQSLMLMINDILEISRADAGRTGMLYETVDVGDVIGMAVELAEPLARGRAVEVSWDIDPDVPLIEADFDKLRHIMINLLSNAVKFTPDGGHVRVRAGRCAGADGSDAVYVLVADDGIGIAPEDQERIFEKFVQVDSTISRRYSGTGLGLPLARAYAEMHGGSLTVQSALGRGATFRVELPVAQWRADAACGEGE